MNIVLRNNILNNTRKLGTRIDAYIEDFVKTSLDNGELKTFAEWKRQSKNYSQKNESTTIRQVREVFYLLGIIDEDENIIIGNFSTVEEFKILLEKSIREITLQERFNKNKHKNIGKLFNNFILSLWVNNDFEFSHKEFYENILKTRIHEFESKYIDKDSDDLREYVDPKINAFLDYIDYKKDEKIENEIIRKDDVKNKDVKEFREKINTDTINSIEFISRFINSETKIIIPFFQREYVWSDSLAINLVEDILNRKNEFLNLGNILIKIDDHSHIIIDGQQRMTTLILMFDIIIKLMKKYNLKEKLSKSCNYLYNNFSSNSIIKKIQNPSNKKYIENLKYVLEMEIDDFYKIKNIKQKESNIISNYISLFDFLSNEKNISKEEITLLFENMNFVFLSETKDKITDPIELFMSTNSLRAPLSNYDLIKSYILSKTKKPTSEIENKLNEIGQKLTFSNRKIDKEIDSFFTLFLEYEEIENGITKSKEKNLFKKFKNLFDHNIKNNDDIIFILDNIIKKLKYYRIMKGNDVKKEIPLNDLINTLSGTQKVNSIYEIILLYFIEVLCENESNKLLVNELRKILYLFEKFEIKWKLFKFHGDSLKSQIHPIFKKIKEEINILISGNGIDEIYEKCKIIIQNSEGFVGDQIRNNNNEEYKDIINSDAIKKDLIAQKILNRVCFYLFNSKRIDININDTFYKIEKPSIEHVFPKKSIKWEKEDKENTMNLKEHLEDIGNKFIFDKKGNTSISNKVFLDKLKIYDEWGGVKNGDKTLHFSLEKGDNFNLFELKKWTPSNIEKRNKYIINTLLEFWKKL